VRRETYGNLLTIEQHHNTVLREKRSQTSPPERPDAKQSKSIDEL